MSWADYLSSKLGTTNQSEIWRLLGGGTDDPDVKVKSTVNRWFSGATPDVPTAWRVIRRLGLDPTEAFVEAANLAPKEREQLRAWAEERRDATATSRVTGMSVTEAVVLSTSGKSAAAPPRSQPASRRR